MFLSFRIAIALAASALFLAFPVRSEEAPPVLDAETSALTVLALNINRNIRDTIWPGWSDTPFEILVVAKDTEFLLSERPRTGQGFAPNGKEISGLAIRYRDRVFDTGLLATFPAFGPPATIVVGELGNTGLSPAGWIATVGHEHFHQYQYSLPGYYDGVNALDLAGGDDSGMWMLNYPFPYDDEAVGAAFHRMALSLARAQMAVGVKKREERLTAYLAAKEAFRALLDPRDYRYFTFQTWQEGVARYTQYMFARGADLLNYGFEDNDGNSFTSVANSLLRRSLEALGEPEVLARQKRVAFYAFGMIEAMVLDKERPGWKERYSNEMFSTDSYFNEK